MEALGDPVPSAERVHCLEEELWERAEAARKAEEERLRREAAA